jgi:hypothetical protein
VLQWVSVGAGMAAILGMVSGGLLLFLPRRVLDGANPLRRLLFETNIGEPFSRKFAIERGVYRRHRLFGTAVVLGGMTLAALVGYLVMNPRVMNLHALVGKAGLRVAIAVAAACALILLIIGLCLIIRPSVLKGIETAANRWVEPRPPGPTLSAAVLRSPRLVGVLLLVGGALNLRLI